MKNINYVLLLIIIAIGCSVLLLFKRKLQERPFHNMAVSNNPANVSLQTNLISTRGLAASNNGANIRSGEILEEYHAGAISKGQAMRQLSLLQNKNLDFYGQVIDQYGQPVVGAKVKGDVIVNTGFIQEKDEVHFTETDPSGDFSFLGLNGSGLGIWPQKAGYFYNLKLPSKRPDDYIPNPSKRIIFMMWKLRGAESLVNWDVETNIPYDGAPIAFDTRTGKVTPNGDLRVMLSRFPVAIAPGLMHPYNWQFKIEISDGGLLREDDLYPYLAPENGYRSTAQFTMSSNSIPWSDELNEYFYLKNSQGQYGRMHVDLNTSSKRHETGISIQMVINPSGSENLQPASL